MSDFTISGISDYSDFSNFAFTKTSGNAKKSQNKKHKSNDKKLTILKIVVFILALLLLLEIILYTIVIPCLAPAKVEFSGVRNLSVQELSDSLNEMGSPTWMQFDTARAVSVLSTISCIERVSVDKHFPDKVVIQISERTPVAKTIVVLNGRSTPIQIDKNGVLFTSNATSIITDSSIPLISGLPLERIQDGTRLPSRYRPLMEQISEISVLPQKYFAAISEIQIIPKEYGNYELVLYPTQMRVRVLTDRSLNEEALEYMMVVLDVVNSIEPNVEEIDLRYGSVSYRKHQ